MIRRILKIANKIIESAVVLPDENSFKKYLQEHPDYREDTEFIVNGTKRQAPKKQKNTEEENKRIAKERLSGVGWEAQELAAQVESNDSKNVNRLHLLSYSEHKRVRVNVAKNTASHIKTLNRLKNDEFSDVRSAVVNNSKTTPEMIDDISKNETSEFVLLDILKCKRTSPTTVANIVNEVLEDSQDKNKGNRLFVLYNYASQNPNTPSEILEKCSRKNKNCARLVAVNPSASEDLLRELHERNNNEFAPYVVKNKNCPKDLLESAINSDSKSMRRAVADNRVLTVEQFEQLSKDNEPNVRFGVIKNPSAPSAIIKHIMENDISPTNRNFAKAELRRRKEIS